MLKSNSHAQTRHGAGVSRRLWLTVFAAVVALALAACGGNGDDDQQAADEDPPSEANDDHEDADPDPEPDPADEPARDDEPDPDNDEPDPDNAEDGNGTGDTGDPDEGARDSADGADPLEGTASTDESSQDSDASMLGVVDVRVSSHDGFDRVVFELDGDEQGNAGWHVRYDPEGEATAQGSGQSVDVEGQEVLAVALHGVGYPDDLPDGVQRWDGDRLDGPADGVVLEVVEDTIFEGVHTFFVGTDAQYGFVVGHLDDPERVVIDLHHES